VLQQSQQSDARHQSMDAMDRAVLLSNLAHAAHGLQNLDAADRYYEQAGTAYEKLFPNGSPDFAILLNNRASLQEERNEPAAALALYRRSLAMRRKVLSSPHPMIVVALSNVARLSIKQGDRDAALKAATEAADMADRVYTEPNRFHPSVYATLAASQLAANDVQSARVSMAKSQKLLATLDEPPPSVVRWIERVRADLCSRPEASEVTPCPPAPGSASAR
jgi:eukaryotic-like serine/threonine-protein kinase